MPTSKVQIVVEIEGKQVKGEILGLENALAKLGTQGKTAGSAATQGLNQLGSAAAHAQQSMTGAVLQANLMTEAILGLARGLKTITIDSTLYAARTKVLGTVLQNLARVNGISTQTINEQESAIKDLGITTQEARNTLNRFIQANLDVTKAAQLARVAQDAGVVGAVNSAEALERLTHGIVTLQPEILRTIGITVNFEAEYKRFAAETKRTTDSLSQQEKQQIALNAVMQQGQRLAGTYEAAMGDVGKQLTSLSRHFEEAQNAVGSRFQSELSLGVKGLAELLQLVQKYPDAFIAAAEVVAGLGVAVTALAMKTRLLSAATFLLTPGFGQLTLVVIGLVGAYQMLSSAMAVVNREQERNLQLSKSLSEFERGKAAGLSAGEMSALWKQAEAEANALTATADAATLYTQKLNDLIKAKAQLKGKPLVMSVTAGGPAAVGTPGLSEDELKAQEDLTKLAAKLRIERLSGAQKEVAALNEQYRENLLNFKGNEEQKNRLAGLYAQQRVAIVAKAEAELHGVTQRYVELQPASLEAMSEQLIASEEERVKAVAEIQRQAAEATTFSLGLEQQTRLAMAASETEKLAIQYDIDLQNFELSELRKTLSKDEASKMRELIEAKYNADIATLAQREQEKQIKDAEARYQKLYDNIYDHASHAFDLMFQKGKSVWEGLASAISSIWLTLVRKMFADTVAGLLTPLFNSLRGGFAGVGGGGTGVSPVGSFLGNLLGGTGSPLSGGVAGGRGGFSIPGLNTNAGGFETGLGMAGGTPTPLNSTGGLTSFPTSAGTGALAMGASSLIGSTAGPAGFGGFGIAGSGASLFGSAAAPGWAATHGMMGVSFASMGHGLGAAAGFLATNPIGWAILGGIGAFAAWKIFHKSREDKFRQEIQRDFALIVDDKKTLKTIKDYGENVFGKLADKKRFETLRLEQVQRLLYNYAVMTGQDPSKLPYYQGWMKTAPQAVRLEQASGLSTSQAYGVNQYQTGGLVHGPWGRDRVPARLSAGEYVLRPEAVRSLGVSNLDRLNALTAPSAQSLSRGAGEGQERSEVRVTIAPVINVSGATDPVRTAQQVKAAVLDVIKSSTREITDAVAKGLRSDYRRGELRAALNV